MPQIKSFKPEGNIGQYPAKYAVLKINSDFTIPDGYDYAGTIIAEGLYYPDKTFNDGYVSFISNNKIKVDFPWYYFDVTTFCYGGLRVNMADPYKNYEFIYYGCGDPISILPVPQTIDFDIGVVKSIGNS